MKITVTSDPSDYTVVETVLIDAKSLEQSNMVVQESHTLEVKFDMTYDSTNAPNYGAQFMNAYCQGNELMCDNVSERQGESMFGIAILCHLVLNAYYIKNS